MTRQRESHLIHVAALLTWGPHNTRNILHCSLLNRCTTLFSFRKIKTTKSHQLVPAALSLYLLVRIPVVLTLHLFEEVWTLSGLFGRKSKREALQRLLLAYCVLHFEDDIISKNSGQTLISRLWENLFRINWYWLEGQPICCRSTVCTGFIGWADTMAGSRAWPSNSNMES